MADNDEFLKARGQCWKKMVTAAYEYGDPYEVAALAPEGICKLLRSCGGLPAFREFEAILKPFFVTDGQPQLFSGNHQQAEKACEAIARQYAGSGMNSVLAEIELRIAKGILLQSQMQGLIVGEPGETLVSRFLPELVEARIVGVFDTAPKLIERFTLQNGGAAAGMEALHDFCDEVNGYLEPATKHLVTKLAHDPSGQSLPRRPQRMPKRSTAESLNIVIG